MKYLLILVGLALSLLPLNAQTNTLIAQVETNWPGIYFQLTYIGRLPPDRLLVGVRLLATEKASPGGTLIGTNISIPPNANPSDVAAGYYHPLPFTMDSSVMTDELTHQNYQVLPSIAPPGKKYRPAVLLETLLPGRSSNLVLQFKIPPPPLAPNRPPVKQTLSFLFTNAKGAIMHIPLPPAGP